jgi:hypothetical protein
LSLDSFETFGSDLPTFLGFLKTMNNGIKKNHLPQKTCVICERPFSWRKKWQTVWDEVKYCSDACRKGTPRMGSKNKPL